MHETSCKKCSTLPHQSNCQRPVGTSYGCLALANSKTLWTSSAASVIGFVPPDIWKLMIRVSRLLGVGDLIDCCGQALGVASSRPVFLSDCSLGD
jgi:hypothetical protein